MQIPLSNSDLLIEIDEIDLDLALENWHLTDDGYVRSNCSQGERFLHRRIGIKLGYKDEIDHKDGNALNNKRSNLRNATRKQNGANRFHFKWKGYSKHHGKFQARIRVNGVVIPLGRFDTEIEAARAYNRAAKLYFGEFANLNQGV